MRPVLPQVRGALINTCLAGRLPIVRREIQGIEELLEEEPDSRCAGANCALIDV